MNQIWLLLGLKSDSFASGLKRASDETKAFEKDWKSMAKLFGAGGMVGLVVQFFSTIIEHARNAKGAIDENTSAVRRFGDGVKDTWDIVMDAVVSDMGMLNRTGEQLTRIALIVKEFGKNLIGSPLWDRATGQQLVNLWKSSADAVDSRASAADEALRVERETAEERKKNGARYEQITARLKQQEEQRKEISLKSLTAQEQYNARTNELVALEEKLAAFTGATLERRELELRVSEARTKQLEAQYAAERENGQFLKRLNEEIFAGVEEQDRLTADLAKSKKEQADAAAEQARFEAQIAAEKAKQLEIDQQLAALNKRAHEEMVWGMVSSKYSSDEIRNASPGALREAIRRIESEQQLLRQRPGNAFQYENSLQITKNENTLTRLRGDLALRETIASLVGRYGVEGGRRFFGGDPLVFDRLAQEFAGQRDLLREQTDTMNRLNATLGVVAQHIGATPIPVGQPRPGNLGGIG